MAEPTTWTIDAVLALMDEQGLLIDMLPTHNEIEDVWYLCLSDERGNGIEYVEFATEAEADAFSELLGAAIENRAVD
ncbi:hypothetical protein BH11MYX1_BH11MYX1_43770 [soil metagenome]